MVDRKRIIRAAAFVSDFLTSHLGDLSLAQDNFPRAFAKRREEVLS